MSSSATGEGIERIEGIGAGTRRRLAGFARTLRDNGFKIGLAETRDALAILASPAATRRASLKPALRALFAATRFEWERFDDVFDAYWSGRGMRRIQAPSAPPPAAGAASSRRLGQAAVQPPFPGSSRPPRAPRRSERRQQARSERTARRRFARREPGGGGCSARRRSGRGRAGARAGGAAGADHAGAARSSRAGAPARAAARHSPHDPSQRVKGRNADRPRLAPPQGEALAARRPARRLGLDEFLYGVLRALPARRRRFVPRGRGVRFSHPACARIAVAARSRRRARRRSAGTDGAGYRRRHAHRREPGDLQSLACAAGDQLAHRDHDRIRRLRYRRARAARRARCGGCGGDAGASSGSTR